MGSLFRVITSATAASFQESQLSNHDMFVYEPKSVSKPYNYKATARV